MSGAASNPVSLSGWPLSTRLPFLSRPIYLHSNLGSTLLQALLHGERRTTYLLHLNTWSSNWDFFFFFFLIAPTKWCSRRVLVLSWNFSPSKWVKSGIAKTCRRVGKVLRGGETRHCQDSSVCVCVCVCVRMCVCFTSVFPEPWGLYWGLVKEKESPMAISVT